MKKIENWKADARDYVGEKGGFEIFSEYFVTISDLYAFLIVIWVEIHCNISVEQYQKGKVCRYEARVEGIFNNETFLNGVTNDICEATANNNLIPSDFCSVARFDSWDPFFFGLPQQHNET